jgi:hypothetical protein
MSSTKGATFMEQQSAGTVSLPPPDTERWSARRKAAVVMAARTGVISREEACRRYCLSPEELAAWETALDENGIPGLRSTRQQNYRYALTGRVRPLLRRR